MGLFTSGLLLSPGPDPPPPPSSLECPKLNLQPYHSSLLSALLLLPRPDPQLPPLSLFPHMLEIDLGFLPVFLHSHVRLCWASSCRCCCCLSLTPCRTFSLLLLHPLVCPKLTFVTPIHVFALHTYPNRSCWATSCRCCSPSTSSSTPALGPQSWRRSWHHGIINPVAVLPPPPSHGPTPIELLQASPPRSWKR